MLEKTNSLLLRILITLSAPHSVPSRGGSNFVLQDVSPSTKHQSPAHIKCCNRKAMRSSYYFWMSVIILRYTAKLRQSLSFSHVNPEASSWFGSHIFKDWLSLSIWAGNIKEIDGHHHQEQNPSKIRSPLFKKISFSLKLIWFIK